MSCFDFRYSSFPSGWNKGIGLFVLTFCVAGSAAAQLKIADFQTQATGDDEYRIEWNSAFDKTYVIEGTTGFEGDWQSIVTNIPATPPVNTQLLTRADNPYETFRIRGEQREGLFINEFMANSSSAGLEDPDDSGEFPDWIELYNNTPHPIDISGWAITDDLDVPGKFIMPSGTVPAFGFLVLYADGEPEQGPTHLGFKLSAGGEAVGLSSNGVSLIDGISFDTQTEDESYGRFPDGSDTWVIMTNATPGNANMAGFSGDVADTKFSVDRGFFTQPFTVAITSATTAASIYYTTDFSAPSPTNGIVYTHPITITNTTCLRAAAFFNGLKPTDVDTHTYIFPDQVLEQPADPSGWPEVWRVDNPVFPPDALYEMDPAVIAAYPRADLTNSLMAIPSVSIVTSMDNLFHPDTGIYVRPELRDLAGERPCSVEWIQPDGSPSIGVNCGLRIQGNWARMFAKKRPFRLLFKGAYGPTTLNYPVFKTNSATTSFNTLILRSNAQGDPDTEIEDEFSRRAVRKMGHPQSHGTYVHLYINGLYWGLYNPVERPMSDFCASYLGGNRDDWDSHNGDGSLGGVDGNLGAWNALNTLIANGLADNTSYQRIQGNNPDGSSNTAYPRYLDPENYIDYILFNFWGNMADWPKSRNNWYGARFRPEESLGYRWFIWDAEAVFNTGDETTVTNIPAHVHAALKLNPEYRLRFADHTHRHLFNDGVLTTQNTINLYTQMMAEVETFMPLEEARWSGWTNANNGQKWYSVDKYNQRVNYIQNFYLPGRRAVVLEQFKNADLYPDLSAPVFHIDGSYQHGGSIASNAMFSMTHTDSEAMYYTIDGTDPREHITGHTLGTLYTTGVPMLRTTQIKARSFSAINGWSALNEAIFTLDTLSPIRVTEIMYNPRPPTPGTAETNYPSGDFEFIELQNTGDHPIGLAGLAFNTGIRFDFSEAPVSTLAPGEYAILVRNLSAFAIRYPDWTGITILGRFQGRFYKPTGSLANNGESLGLTDGLGRDIQQFVYDDAWHPTTDGNGYSLTIIDPSGTLSNWNLMSGWMPSANIDGSPGTGP